MADIYKFCRQTESRNGAWPRHDVNNSGFAVNSGKIGLSGFLPKAATLDLQVLKRAFRPGNASGVSNELRFCEFCGNCEQLFREILATIHNLCKNDG